MNEVVRQMEAASLADKNNASLVNFGIKLNRKLKTINLLLQSLLNENIFFWEVTNKIKY